MTTLRTLKLLLHHQKEFESFNRTTNCNTLTKWIGDVNSYFTSSGKTNMYKIDYRDAIKSVDVYYDKKITFVGVKAQLQILNQYITNIIQSERAVVLELKLNEKDIDDDSGLTKEKKTDNTNIDNLYDELKQKLKSN